MARKADRTKIGPIQRRRQTATTLCWGFAIVATMVSLLWAIADVVPTARGSGALEAAVIAMLGTACAIGYIRRSIADRRWAMVLVVYVNGLTVWGAALSHSTLAETCTTLLACALVAAVLVRVWLCVPEVDVPGRCIYCGYDLTGNTSGRCSECGEPIDGGPGVADRAAPENQHDPTE